MGLESAGLMRGCVMGGTLQEMTESGVSFQNCQAKKEEQMSSGFKHDLLSLTLLIIFGLHANNSAFSKFLHHKHVTVMWFACFVKLTISPFLNISSGGCSS
jgi:hypothetical protein